MKAVLFLRDMLLWALYWLACGVVGFLVLSALCAPVFALCYWLATRDISIRHGIETTMGWLVCTALICACMSMGRDVVNAVRSAWRDSRGN